MADPYYKNSGGEHVYTDEGGEEYVLDEDGLRRPPMQSGQRTISESGFHVYESPDHCGLCGRLTCRGQCFK